MLNFLILEQLVGCPPCWVEPKKETFGLPGRTCPPSCLPACFACSHQLAPRWLVQTCMCTYHSIIFVLYLCIFFLFVAHVASSVLLAPIPDRHHLLLYLSTWHLLLAYIHYPPNGSLVWSIPIRYHIDISIRYFFSSFTRSARRARQWTLDSRRTLCS